MRITKRWVSAVALYGALAPGSVSAQHHESAHPAHAHVHWHSKPEAVAALRLLHEGGNVVFVRHAKTDMLTKDGDGGDWADCSWQRNLSPVGREASHEMGQAIRLLDIRIGDVWSSPYCRSMDTAWRAFGRAEPISDLAPRPGGAPGEGMRPAGQALRALAERPVEPGTNNVIVAHIFNALGALGSIPEEGEALILRPDASGTPRIVGRLTMTQWGDLVRDLKVFGLDPAQDARSSGHREHTRP